MSSRSSKSPRQPAALPKNQMSLLSFLSPTTKPKEDSKKRQADDDEDVEVVGSASTPKSARVPAKRARVVISSDDEDENVERDESLTRTPKTPKSTSRAPLSARSTPMSTKRSSVQTPTSSQRPIDKTTESFIGSFQFNASLTDFDQSEISIPKTNGKSKSSVQKLLVDQGRQTVVFKHLTFKHLQKDQIMDAEKRRPDHPDYDPRTLYVPQKFLDEASAGHRQWWKLKAQHFDTILFFKVGKFYELYHQDAVIGCEKLGLTYMRGDYAHSGFPEIAYGRYAEQLVDLGFKVARIEQTETPKELEERKKEGKAAPKDKVVRRELCRITSSATQTYGILDRDEEKDPIDTGEPNAQYLLTICERKSLEEGPTKTRFGVCFVDCATGQFNLCEFTDDTSYSKLRTLLANNEPSRLLHERNGLSSSTQLIVSSLLGCIPSEALKVKKEFLTAENTLEWLTHTDYLGSTVANWPKALLKLLADPADSLPKPRPSSELCWSALGATIWYLRECLIDVDLVTMRRFEIYTPATIYGSNMMLLDPSERWNGRRMILDGCALKALHLLPPAGAKKKKRKDEIGTQSEKSSDEEAMHFSLFNTINRTVTPFGLRMLRRWICAPLCDPTELQNRQEAVKFLCSAEAKSLVEYFVENLKGIPDLERLFQRIHTMGLKFRSVAGCDEREAAQKHPDARANFFFADKYNQRKVRDLCTTLDALDKLHKLFRFFARNVGQQVADCPLLVLDCLSDEYADMSADLSHFKKYIGDRAKAEKSGQILPDRQTDVDYDHALRCIDQCNEELDSFLSDQQKTLRSSSISFTGTGRNRYQLEVPENIAKNLDDSYVLTSKKKGYKRFRTEELESLIEGLTEAEKQRDVLQDDFTRRVFEDFDQRKNKWARVLLKVANFDCLVSLARYASSCSLEMCMPKFDFETTEPTLEIRRGHHPALAGGHGVLSANCTTYIPNDTVLGGQTPATLLLSGANMGGKSTLMRQTAVLSVLAQMGSYVPATSMKLSPIDRVFCRIGANDCLAAGHSTFYVELEETSAILREATAFSLVICDELGRGTSTHDGTAVASSVLRYLADKIKCRVLFSTHYHSLCTFFENNPRISLGHMACLVENELDEDPSMENITFLYTLTDGPAPKSYGFFTARMAGLDQQLIRRAYDASQWVFCADKSAEKLDYLSKCVKENEIDDDELIAAIHGQ